jgi:hypothetical protein
MIYTVRESIGYLNCDVISLSHDDEYPPFLAGGI